MSNKTKENFFLVLTLIAGFLGVFIFKQGVGYYLFVVIATVSALIFMFYSVKTDFFSFIHRWFR